MALLAADTELRLCCNGGHGVANSVVRGGGATAVQTTGRGREKGKCVAKGHLEREGAGPHSSNGRRKEMAVRHSEPRREARRNVAPAAEERRGGSLSRRRKAETQG